MRPFIKTYLWEIAVILFFLGFYLFYSPFFRPKPPDERLIRTISTGSQVNSIALSPDDQLIASVSKRSEAITLWRTSDGQVVSTIPLPKSKVGDDVRSIAFSPDGAMLAVPEIEGMVGLWRVVDGQLAQTFQIATPHDRDSSAQNNDPRINKASIVSVAFSPDGSLLAAADDFEKIWVWTMADGAVLALFDKQDRCPDPFHLAFSADNQLLAVGCDAGSAYIWEISTGTVRHHLSDMFAGHRNNVAFQPDSSLIATGGDAVEVKLWSVATGDVVATFVEEDAGGMSLGFNPDRTLLAAGGRTDVHRLGGVSHVGDYSIRVWDVVNQRLFTTLPGHTNHLTGVIFSHDGQFIVSSSKDETIRIWRLE